MSALLDTLIATAVLLALTCVANVLAWLFWRRHLRMFLAQQDDVEVQQPAADGEKTQKPAAAPGKKRMVLIPYPAVLTCPNPQLVVLLATGTGLATTAGALLAVTEDAGEQALGSSVLVCVLSIVAWQVHSVRRIIRVRVDICTIGEEDAVAESDAVMRIFNRMPTVRGSRKQLVKLRRRAPLARIRAAELVAPEDTEEPGRTVRRVARPLELLFPERAGDSIEAAFWWLKDGYVGSDVGLCTDVFFFGVQILVGVVLGLGSGAAPGSKGAYAQLWLVFSLHASTVLYLLAFKPVSDRLNHWIKLAGASVETLIYGAIIFATAHPDKWDQVNKLVMECALAGVGIPAVFFAYDTLGPIVTGFVKLLLNFSPAKFVAFCVVLLAKLKEGLAAVADLFGMSTPDLTIGGLEDVTDNVVETMAGITEEVEDPDEVGISLDADADLASIIVSPGD